MSMCVKILAALLLAAVTAVAESGHFVMPSAPAGVADLLLHSLLWKTALAYEPAMAEQKSWPGEEPELSANIQRVTARFRGSGSERSESDWFDVALDFSPNGIVVRTSLRVEPGATNAATVRYVPSSAYSGFLWGPYNRGVAIFIPELDGRPQAPKGVLLCPRELGEYAFGKELGQALVDSEYRLARGVYLAEGSVDAKTDDQALALTAEILTTPNIPAGTKVKADGKQAVSLEYAADKTELVLGSEAGVASSGAIAAQVRYGREVTRVASDAVWFEQVRLARDQVFEVKMRTKALRVGPGVCYVMWKQRDLLPFVMKERMHGSNP